MTPEDFLKALSDIAEGARLNQRPSSVFFTRIREHFEADPSALPIVTESFKTTDHPDLHLAVEAYLSAPERSATLMGFTSEQDRYVGLRINDLLVSGESAPVEGPVQYRNVQLDEGQVLACVHKGLFLVRSGDIRLAVLLRGPSRDYRPSLDLDVMAKERSDAEAFLAEIRRSMKKRSVYRGKVLTLEENRDGTMDVHIKKLPQIEKNQIILQAGLLERVERQTISFSKHAQELRASGRHLRRGVLLYGPPGTGKTLSAMYLASQMPERTVLLVTGRGMGLIGEVCSMARALQPATVILEDVDLVAEQRTRQNASCNAVLFELLNEMDGLAEDADILFLLTTNRPDILEPALAARPGRIDMAIEVPVPDDGCRRRLFHLYGQGLRMEVANLDSAIKRTEGVSASFIRELIRKAALGAADEGNGNLVTNKHLDEALHELLIEGGGLTRSLLGASVRRE